MEQKTVFIGATGYDHYCTEGRKKLLDAGCCLIENQLGRPYTAEELKAIGGEINAVICGCEVWNEETIAAAPNLKVIVKFGVGVDNIDQEAAKRHGVQVANCPGMNSVAVAEQTFALLLGCMREVPALDRAVREGRWDRRVFPEIYGSVFGVLGFGAAGREIALRARAFGAEVLAYDKYPNYAFAEQIGAKIVSLDEVLEQADIISVNLPALPDTLHIINAENIARMRRRCDRQRGPRRACRRDCGCRSAGVWKNLCICHRCVRVRAGAGRFAAHPLQARRSLAASRGREHQQLPEDRKRDGGGCPCRSGGRRSAAPSRIRRKRALERSFYHEKVLRCRYAAFHANVRGRERRL